MRKYITHATAVVVGLMALAGLSRPASAQYFKGKTISIVVGFSKGGGVDEMARIFADNLSQYIPGNPTIVVRNMPDEARAQNYIYENANTDGTEIGFNTFGILSQIIGLEGTRYKYDKFTYVAGLKSASYMTFARVDAVPGGIKKPEDIMKATDLKYTGRIASHTIDAIAIGALDILGVKYTYVPGHPGSNEITDSILKNETNITGSGLNMWLDFIIPKAYNKGIVVPLWQHRFITPEGKSTTIEQYGDMPTFEDVYKRIYGKDPSGPEWDAYNYLVELQGTANFFFGGPPNMNPEATQILRDAFIQIDKDPKMIKISKDMMEGFQWENVTYQQAKPLLDKLAEPHPEYTKYWKDKIARLQAIAK